MKADKRETILNGKKKKPGLVAQSFNPASGGQELWDGWRLLTLLRVALVFKYQLFFKKVLHHDALSEIFS